MPTTTRSRTQSRTTTELDRDREFEALEVGIAPGFTGDEAGERERAGLGAGRLGRAGAHVAQPTVAARRIRRGLFDQRVENTVRSAVAIADAHQHISSRR
jgi:hypothetical protein